ncbi:hypothetical protein [Actinacidiphila sp. ITFR-21]|uniref:hypothetical protein n=1 Tax=Actinacidiphila sp. ITFR-21 TaxID=3075199 RepID=UPI002889C7EE|nr:hypothetical protein [Streptomyces sp. ITFR-21]WNI17676.1 hypothetical protein RLT57_20515 [Streptomyces sp. ITFR-21]WNI17816.1 hypothetical protein RLT57_21230 [Streptomyces sp. ITFR-21]
MIGGVVGYTYQAENLCPSCTLKAMRANGITVQKGKSHEDAIRRAAQKLDVDFDDESSYDSGDFPKAVTEQMCETELNEVPNGEQGVRHAISDERCTGDKCGKWLVLGEKSPTEAGLTRWVRDEYELPQALARAVAGKLREWGLSHSEFISEDNVRQAAAEFPHDYATVHAVGNPQRVELLLTPETDDDTCFHCGQPWEGHAFICNTCQTEVPAVSLHRHPIVAKGQRKLPLAAARSDRSSR